MKEKDIEREVCKYARETYGMLTYKFTSPANAGVPDRIVISKDGVVAFIEFKAPGKTLTPLQQRKAAELDEHNCDVFMIDNVEAGKTLINLMSNPTEWLLALGYRTAIDDDAPKILLPSQVSNPRH